MENVAEKELTIKVQQALELPVKVTNQVELELAGIYAKQLKSLLDEIYDCFEPIKKSTHAAWNVACEKEKEKAAPVLARMSQVKAMIADFLTAEERRRAEEEKRRQEDARKLMELSAEAEASGDTELAREAIAEALVTHSTDAAPKVSGLSMRKFKRWRITDIDAVPRGYLSPDVLLLNAIASAGGRDIPGVEFYDEASVSVRTK